MNLLTDAWIPIQQQGRYQKIGLQQLLCGEADGELCLPRDDMELACLQLLCAITQTLFTPKDKKELGRFVQQPLTPEAYAEACEEKLDWFDLDHPETPFMQFRNVKATELTSLDKLMAGLSGGENKVFVNQQGLAGFLCGGCVAIALFNSANNCPSVGGGNRGGFKAGLRGSTPITVLIGGRNLRQTVWFNVLTEESVEGVMPWYQDCKNQLPNYLDKVKAGEKINASTIGLNRGLLWQPAHYELMPAQSRGRCSCCNSVEHVYTGFKKEQFGYEIEGIWPHPLSSRTFVIKKGEKEEKFSSFTNRAPTWTHLARLVIDQQNDKEGQQAAPVVQQARKLMASDKITLIVGGYRSNKADVLERRHELFSLAQGWAEHGLVIHKIIEGGLAYKSALRNALLDFEKGKKTKLEEIKGAGINLYDLSESNFYQRSESLLHRVFVGVNFTEPNSTLHALNRELKKVVLDLFEQSTDPYRQEPKMLKALALARRSLHKSLNELEPEGVKA